MPLLTDGSGHTPAMVVLRHEYERRAAMHRHNLNWLVVRAEVHDANAPPRAFTKTLTTWGLQQLVHWLRAVADAEPVPADWIDMERSISFTAERDDGALTLAAHVRRWFTPAERRDGGTGRSEMIDVTFSPSADDVRRFADELVMALSAFPVREPWPDA